MSSHIEYHPSLLPHKAAVTLVAHGLNQKPEAMLSLVKYLSSLGSDVYLVRLSGHHKDGIPITEVTSSSVWQQEMLDGYTRAERTSAESSVPLYFLGYSLGALLAQSMIALSMKHTPSIKDTPSLKHTPFTKQILIAPAFAIHPRSYLVKLFFLFGKQRNLLSFSPVEYRVNDALPLFIYDILFNEEKRVIRAGFSNANIPTLVFIDRRDELISFKRLQKQISDFNLTNYRILPLKQNANERKYKFRHLIVDEPTMGKSNWEMVTSQIKSFFF
jgi:hypothetical protein